MAAGLVARALTVAIPSGDMGLLRPSVLHDIGFDLVRRGQSVVASPCRPRRPRPVAPSGYKPIQWFTEGRSSLVAIRFKSGRVQSQQTSVEVGSESVAHFRINCEALTPYRGRAPLQLAAATGQLARALSGSLGDEASVAVARILALPAGSGEAVINGLKAAISNPSQGRVASYRKQRRSGFGARVREPHLREIGGPSESASRLQHRRSSCTIFCCKKWARSAGFRGR